MRVTCPHCEASYRLAEGSLGATGRKVRCTRCGTTWHARPSVPPVLAEEGREELARQEPAFPKEAEASSFTPPSEDDWRAALTEGSESWPKIAGGPLAEEDIAPPVTQEKDGAAPMPTVAASAEAASISGEEAPAPEKASPEVLKPSRMPKRGTKKKRAGSKGESRIMRVFSAAATLLAGLTLTVIIAGSLFARETLVRAFPDLASLYALAGIEINLRGLAFPQLKTYREKDGSTPVLVVEGVIENITGDTKSLPRLRFGLRSNLGREVYAWTMEAPKSTLNPGETLTFKSRLPSPPDTASAVVVRFTDRR